MSKSLEINSDPSALGWTFPICHLIVIFGIIQSLEKEKSSQKTKTISIDAETRWWKACSRWQNEMRVNDKELFRLKIFNSQWPVVINYQQEASDPSLVNFIKINKMQSWKLRGVRTNWCPCSFRRLGLIYGSLTIFFLSLCRRIWPL